MLRKIPKYSTILAWSICGIGAIFYCYEYLLRVTPSVMIPHLMGAFGVTASALGMLTALYYIAYTPMQIIVGVLLDRYGARRVMTLAIIACTLGSFLFSTAVLLKVAGIGRFLIGFGSAFAFVGVMKLAAEWLPKHHFALFAGFAISLGMAGAMIGDIGLTAAVHTIGWHHALDIGTIIGVVLIPVIWLAVRDTPKWYSQRKAKKVSYSQAFAGMWQISQEFAQIEYTEAITELQKANKKFDFEPKWGIDLQTEHERYLTEELLGRPVAVINYPKEIKAFYMRMNDDDKTVAAMDILAPGIGEIIGGSQREERLEVLDKRIEEMQLHKELYWWYRDLRRYGTVPHGGFGLGFERFVGYITGMTNIRDVIAYPRTPKHAEF